MWFLNCRAEPVGGDVGPVRVTDGTSTFLTYPQLLADMRGKHVLLALHGFNVHQAGAIDHFEQWSKLLTLGTSGVFVGGLWPGDSSWLGAVEYAFAAKAAMRSGDALAAFLNRNFGEALSLSLVSHSLGARVALRLLQQLNPALPVRHLVLMAPAVDSNCLTGEFAAAAERVQHIHILASDQDTVLEFAYPLGNPISGIFAQGHPYWHPALGRTGPSSYPSPNNIHAGWQLPRTWKVNHSDYLPPTPYPAGMQPGPYALPVDFPVASADAPAPSTPPGFELGQEWRFWQSAWSAALTSSRFQDR